MNLLFGINVVLGITGGIAAYKSCELTRSLIKEGATVQVVMTRNASKFVTPLTLQTLSNNKVAIDMFDLTTESEIGHIKIADNADIIIVAPASASFIGKIASGIADSLLATIILATKAKIIICPAMNVNMYSNSIVKENIQKLKDHGFIVMEPGEGDLACGWEGKGRLPETEKMLLEIKKAVTFQDFKDKNILVTSGPTREYIDPTRFISNPSSGKMGYEIAKASWLRGAKTTLICGQTNLSDLYGVNTIRVENSEQMFNKVHCNLKDTDIIIKAAAVSDYTPAEKSNIKIKKSDNDFSLKLKRTKDIIKSVGDEKKNQILVGFAAETDDIVKNALKKIKEKNLDLIVANDVTKTGAGFGSDTNIACIIDRNEKVEELPIMKKFDLANKILDKIKELSA